MALNNLSPVSGTKNRKRVGRGQGSGMGKTATRGSNGQKSRSGFKNKRGFEGGQQPIQRRLPKVGFSSRVVKPISINIERYSKIAELEEITFEAIKNICTIPKSITKVKLIGATAKNLATKIKDENVTTTGN